MAVEDSGTGPAFALAAEVVSHTGQVVMAGRYRAGVSTLLTTGFRPRLPRRHSSSR